jgi:GxxExxY protein
VEENEIGEKLLGCALRVHRALGPELLESAYETCVAYELDKSGLGYKRQVLLPIIYDEIRIDEGYRLDLLIEERVVVEIKAVARLTEIHQAQLISYLKLGRFRLGYLLNFNVPRIKDGIRRVVRPLISALPASSAVKHVRAGGLARTSVAKYFPPQRPQRARSGRKVN